MTYAGFGPPSVSEGNVAFLGGRGAFEGIYFSSGTLQIIADVGTPIPSGTGNFSRFDGQVAVDGVRVGFSADGSGIQDGAYVGNGALSAISNQDTPIPGASGTFLGHNSVQVRDDEVAFVGFAGPGEPGVYRTMPGGLARVADQTTSIPDRTGEFLDFKFLSFDGEQVAFVGDGFIEPGVPGFVGVYSNLGGTLHKVADIDTPVPGGTGLITTVASLSADEGHVAFTHSSTDLEEGVIANFDGTLQSLVNEDTEIPGAGGEKFFRFGGVALSGRNIVFDGSSFDFEHFGVYALYEGEFLRIFEIGDELDGRIISSARLTEDAFGGNQVAFRTEFTDGTSGIYLATIPEPATLTLLAVLGGVMQRRNRPDRIT
jgi:hypothetical protein